MPPACAKPELRFGVGRPVTMRESLAGECAAHLSIFPAKSVVVADSNTHAVLGARVAQELGVPAVVLAGTVKPDEETAAHILKETGNAEALLAVGSGTISDLCKYAASKAGKPYAMFPTAPSMNGYTSANASIIINGLKTSVPAGLPASVLCDMSVITSAPPRLIRAGLGDSVARPTAQADWLLSHLMKGTEYDERPFELVKPYEKELFESARKEEIQVELLMHTLLASGYGMTLAGGSYPASQGEHMIAHAYEMLFGPQDAYHGEQIGVTTLTMAHLQKKLLNKLPPLIAERIRAVMLSATYIESVLKRSGCPTTPRELGWSDENYKKAIEKAPATRDRFTFLSL